METFFAKNIVGYWKQFFIFLPDGAAIVSNLLYDVEAIGNDAEDFHAEDSENI